MGKPVNTLPESALWLIQIGEFDKSSCIITLIRAIFEQLSLRVVFNIFFVLHIRGTIIICIDTVYWCIYHNAVSFASHVRTRFCVPLSSHFVQREQYPSAFVCDALVRSLYVLYNIRDHASSIIWQAPVAKLSWIASVVFRLLEVCRAFFVSIETTRKSLWNYQPKKSFVTSKLFIRLRII